MPDYIKPSVVQLPVEEEDHTWYTDAVQENNVRRAIQEVDDYYKSAGYQARMSNHNIQQRSSNTPDAAVTLTRRGGLSNNYYSPPTKRNSNGELVASLYPNNSLYDPYTYEGMDEYSTVMPYLAAAHERGHNKDELYEGGIENKTHYPSDYIEIMDRKHPSEIRTTNWDEEYAREALHHDNTTLPEYEDDDMPSANYKIETDSHGFSTGRWEDDPGFTNLQPIPRRISRRRFPEASYTATNKHNFEQAKSHDMGELSRAETLADISEARAGFEYEGIWDPKQVDSGGKPVEITQEMLDRYRKTQSGKGSRLLYTFDDQDILQLLNYGY